jgi:hypothetical protein
MGVPFVAVALQILFNFDTYLNQHQNTQRKNHGMKKTITVLLFLTLYIGLIAQKLKTPGADTLAVAQIQSNTMTFEMLLGLHSNDTVIMAEVVYISHGEILKFAFAKTGWPKTPADFSNFWATFIRIQPKGSRITIDGVKFIRGNKEIKLMPKSFILP